MGCDIHCVIEYKKDYDHWTSFGNQSINPGRNYEWFANLAGVRGSPKDRPLATRFGLPEKVSWTTAHETSMFVYDGLTGDCCRGSAISRELADKWVAAGLVKYLEDFYTMQPPDYKKLYTRVTHPDWHTYGWCTAVDWKKSTRGFKWIDIKCMNAIIDTLVKNDFEVRVVFWFDN